MKNGLPEIDFSGVSDVGPVREDNQDAIQLSDSHAETDRGWLCAVADGMGGYSNGRTASDLALEKLFTEFYKARDQSVERALQRGVESANLGVYKKAQQLQAGRMGTTLTAASVIGNQVYVAHVGDSRAYLIRDHKAICLTEDHTTVGDLVRMKVLPPDKVRTHAQRSVLTKGIGLGLFVKPDITQYTLKQNDILVLCSDGVWSVIQDHEFAELAVKTHGARALSQGLVDLALERQTDDNASAITVHIKSVAAHSAQGASRNFLSPLRNIFSRKQLLLFQTSD